MELQYCIETDRISRTHRGIPPTIPGSKHRVPHRVAPIGATRCGCRTKSHQPWHSTHLRRIRNSRTYRLVTIGAAPLVGQADCMNQDHTPRIRLGILPPQPGRRHLARNSPGCLLATGCDPRICVPRHRLQRRLNHIPSIHKRRRNPVHDVPIYHFPFLARTMSCSSLSTLPFPVLSEQRTRL